MEHLNVKNAPESTEESTTTSGLVLPEIAGRTRYDAAQMYAEAGIAVFPVNGKVPASFIHRWSLESTTDLIQIENWSKSAWSASPASEAGPERRGIAIDCGKSNLLVIDVDRPEKVPAEWWTHLDVAPFTSTDSSDPRRGHYFFSQSVVPIGCPPQGWGEVKGSGGYVVAAPSRHACAHPDAEKYRASARYQQIRSGMLTTLPEVISSTFSERHAAAAAASVEEVVSFMDAFSSNSSGEDPRLLVLIADSCIKRMKDEEYGRHPSMVRALAESAKAAKAGLICAQTAHDTFADIFRRAKPEAYASEFADMWDWAIGQAQEEGASEEYRAQWAARRAQHQSQSSSSDTGIQEEPIVDEKKPGRIVFGPIVAAKERGSKLGEGAETPCIAAQRASDIRVRKTEWLYDTTPKDGYPTSGGRIPKDMLTVAAGLPGTGKSQWAIWVTAALTQGILPGSEYGTPRNVVYAATEDDWERTIAPRLIAAGADLDRVFRVQIVTLERKSFKLQVPEHIEELGLFCQQEDVALVVLDPLLSHLGGKLNPNAEKDVRDAVEPLVKAAGRYGFTVIGLSHFNKNSTNSDPVERLMGSRGFSALLRALIVFAKDKESDGENGCDVYVMSQAKNNLGRTDMPSFQYTIASATVGTEDGTAYVSKFVLGPETSNSVEQVMQDVASSGGTNGTDRKEAQEWLYDYLTSPEQGGEDTPENVQRAAQKAGISPNALKTAKGKLKIRSVKSGDGGRTWVWRVPDFQGASLKAWAGAPGE